MIEITYPNEERSLLSAEELRSAAGLATSDTSRDATLTPLGNYVAAAITKACGVARAGIIPPTLREEEVTETFRLKSKQNTLVLARRPVVSVNLVTESLSALEEGEGFEFDAAAGLLYRLSSSTQRGQWSCGDIVVDYRAGWATVPDDLKYAAIKFVQAELSQGSRDPLLKSIRIEGVSERTFWVDPTKDDIVPAEVMSLLRQGGYVNEWVA